MLYSRTFLVMALANLCVSSSYGTFFLFPLFVLRHGGSEADIGIVMGTFALASTLCRPWISDRIDRFGRKRAFTLGCLIMALLPLSYLALHGPLGEFYLLLLAARILHGIGLGLCFTAAFTYVADIIPAERLNEGIGMFGISGLTGMALGPLIGETVLHRGGFSGLFLTASVLGLFGLLLHLPLAESFRPVSDRGKTSFFSQLRRPKIAVAASLAFLFGYGLAAPENFVAPLAEERGISPVSVFFLAYTIAAISIRIFGGRLADRIGEGRVMPYALVITGCGLISTSLAHSVIALGLTGFLTGCGHGLLFPSLSAMALRNEPVAVRGKITGIYTGAIDGGTFAGSFALGYIGECAGLSALFLSAGGVLLLGLAVLRLGSDQK